MAIDTLGGPGLEETGMDFDLQKLAAVAEADQKAQLRDLEKKQINMTAEFTDADREELLRLRKLLAPSPLNENERVEYEALCLKQTRNSESWTSDDAQRFEKLQEQAKVSE